MGVTGLWTVVQPCARPIKLETLNKKRLAVDASIWIYQFLKAVRDKEGNALRNSHVVGFFRRICKLLFFGIKPVFVFDGGAPALKRQTIAGRKQRREGRREDAVRTAGKLLAVQMQRRAEEEDQRQREERMGRKEHEEALPEEMVYVDELGMSAKERQQNRTFRKKDQYHLPDLDVSLSEMGAPDDPRIMSQEELEEYARQFNSGEDINLYDFSKIDFESPFFMSLPASDRYNILNAARLRSRLRMGYSKEQLDTMFPDRMAFSRFQIERVTERNELTQRLMNINGMNGEDAMFGVNGSGRVAGERGREYVLVKNEGVEGGWALGVVTNKDEGQQNKPIDVEGYGRQPKQEEDDWEDEDEGFEDVPIEGLNRLPKRPAGARAAVEYNDQHHADAIAKKRREVYETRRAAASNQQVQAKPQHDEKVDSLFLPDQEDGLDSENDALFEDVPAGAADAEDDEEAELNRAIAMSLEKEDDADFDRVIAMSMSKEKAKDPTKNARSSPMPDFNAKTARDGRAVAESINRRANKPTAGGFLDEEQDEEDGLDLQAALEESRRTKRKPRHSPQRRSSLTINRSQQKADTGASGFGGPLPFESLNLGKSMLSKKKKAVEEEQAGGFEREEDDEDKPRPIPPWFSGQVAKDQHVGKGFGGDRKETRRASAEDGRILQRNDTGEVIDLDDPTTAANEVISVKSSSDDEDADMEDVMPVDHEVRMGDLADQSRAEPAATSIPANNVEIKKAEEQKVESRKQKSPTPQHVPHTDEDEVLDWSESDRDETDVVAKTTVPAGGVVDQTTIESKSPPSGGVKAPESESSKSASPVFENVAAPETAPPLSPSPLFEDVNPPQEQSALPDDSPAEVSQSANIPSYNRDDTIPEDDFSDPEDEDLLRALADEADEHARFASTLNAKSQAENAFDYERELKQLRSQQKKDRRDADEVSHIMVTECQQLLKLFGLPYITAPMEAEAQCAELVSLGLVDGIVTDDSDVFLFGGTRVYKNMFNQAKFVECYLNTDLEKEYALDRRKLIRFAHLLGSDYTEGIPGVGPVTALEILTEFETLEDFRDWWSQVQMGAKLPDDVHSAFRKKFKRNASKLFLPPAFPDTRVDVAYLKPEVDSDPSGFQWGVPDLNALRSFLMATIGWSQERTDEVLVPVIKDINRRENEGTQANITNFFQGGAGAGAFAPRRRADGSGRMEKAFGRLRNQAARKRRAAPDEEQQEDGLIDGLGEQQGNADEESVQPAPKKRKTKGKRQQREATPEADGSDGDNFGDEAYEEPKRKAPKRRRGKK